MKAKSDENRMKGKEDERKRATEKTLLLFLRIEQEGDQNRRFQKEEMKIENEKEEKWRNRRKEDTWKNINNDIFLKNQMVSKKRGDTELECKTGVKHNSKQYTFEH